MRLRATALCLSLFNNVLGRIIRETARRLIPANARPLEVRLLIASAQLQGTIAVILLSIRHGRPDKGEVTQSRN